MFSPPPQIFNTEEQCINEILYYAVYNFNENHVDK